MKSPSSFYLFLCFFLITIPVFSQERTINELESGGLYWTRYYLEWELADRLQLDAEIDNRRFFTPHEQFQTVYRTTLYFLYNDNINFGGGIGHSQLFSIYTSIIQPEIRPHQEVNFKYSEGRWNFNHRIRVEQRFLGDTTRTFQSPEEVTEEFENTYSFDLRTRYEFTTDFTLRDKDRQKGHWNLQVATEIMVRKNWSELFDTTRIYAGLQYYLNQKIRLELGYLSSREWEYDFDVLFKYDNLRFTFRHRL